MVCDDQRMFDLALVKAKDEYFAELCENGVPWELLSSDMDEQEE